MTAHLYKIDRNGTKYYEDFTCPKCGGSGHIAGYDYVEDGICFECSGTGEYHYTWKEYAPEYAEKLARNRAKKANEKNIKKFGLAQDGSAWVVIGDTYAIKDELKAAGASFCPMLGWHFAEDNPNYNTKHFTVNDICVIDIYGKWIFEVDHMATAVKDAQDAYRIAQNAAVSTSDYVGEVGEKITINATCVNISGYDTNWGWASIYIFKDANDNVFIWKTNSTSFEKGEKVTLTGKVKGHNEYKGIKQTILTRCKVL